MEISCKSAWARPSLSKCSLCFVGREGKKHRFCPYRVVGWDVSGCPSDLPPWGLQAPGYLAPGSSHTSQPLESICLCSRPGAASHKASWTSSTPQFFRRNVCRCRISWSHFRSSSCFGGQLLLGADGDMGNPEAELLPQWFFTNEPGLCCETHGKDSTSLLSEPTAAIQAGDGKAGHCFLHRAASMPTWSPDKPCHAGEITGSGINLLWASQLPLTYCRPWKV